MNEQWSFGPLRPEHLEDMARMEEQCFSVPWSREMLAQELENPMAHYVICTDRAGCVLGYIGSRIVLDSADITNVAVAPEHRRQGLGFELVNRMLEEMALRGVSSVLLEVRESNLPAQRCYARAGFSPVGRRRGYYDKPKEDALLMGRQLL